MGADGVKMECRYCNWWDGVLDGENGTCRAYGPSVQLEHMEMRAGGEIATLWPETQPDDWCKNFSDKHRDPIERDETETVRLFIGTPKGVYIGDFPKLLGLQDVIAQTEIEMKLEGRGFGIRRLKDGQEFVHGDILCSSDIEDCDRFDLVVPG